MSDRMPNFLIDKLDYNDVNFRVFTVPVEEAVAGTVCENPSFKFSGNQIWWRR